MSRGPFGSSWIAKSWPSRAPGVAARAILPDGVFHAHAVVHDDAPTRPERDRQGDRVAVPQVHPGLQLELPY